MMEDDDKHWYPPNPAKTAALVFEEAINASRPVRISIKTPEENFVFTFQESLDTRLNYGFVTEEGKLVLKFPEKLERVDAETKEWIRKCYRKWNQK